MPENQQPRAKLPKEFPAPLADFVRCRTDAAELGPGQLTWLPKPKGAAAEMIQDAPPEISFEPNAGGGVDITVGWGFVSFTVTASITNGNLTVTSSNPFLPQDDINEWLDDLNADLRDNGRQFDSVTIEGGKLKMTKKPVAAAAPETEAASVPSDSAPVAVAAGTPAAQGSAQDAAQPAGGGAETPVLGPKAGWRTQLFHHRWKAAGVAGGTLALGVAAFFIFGGGDSTDDTEGVVVPPPPPVIEPADDILGGDDGDALDGDPGDDVLPGDDSGDGDALDGDTGDDTLFGDGQVGMGGIPCDSPSHASGAAPTLPESAPYFWRIDEVHEPCDGIPAYPADGTFTPPSFLHGFDIPVQGPGQVVVSHAGSVPDAVTGETGLSMFTTGFPTNTNQLWGDWFFVNQCGDNTHTAAGSFAEPNAVLGSGPLVQYGPCDGNPGMATGPDGMTYHFLPPVPEFVVDDTEGTLTGQDVLNDDRFPVVIDWGRVPDPAGLGSQLSDANEVSQFLTGNSFGGTDKFWFFNPDNSELVVKVLSAAGAPSSDFWVFAGGMTDVEYSITVTDSVSGDTSVFGAGFGSGTMPTGIGDTLFAQTIFPCGYGRVAFTACPSPEPGVFPDGGEVVLAQMVLESGVMIEQSGTTYGFAFDGDADPATGEALDSGGILGGTDIAYLISLDGESWVVARSDGGTTTARAMIRGNSITLVVPVAEFGGVPGAYRVWAEDADGAGTAVPRIGSPAVAVPDTGAIIDFADLGQAGEPDDAAAGDEPLTITDQVIAFIDRLDTIFETGDTAGLLAIQHPDVIDIYGAEQCEAAIEAQFTVLDGIDWTEFSGPDPIEIAFDGRNLTYEGFEASVVLDRDDGTQSERTINIALVDGELFGFSDCGDPLE